PAQPYLISQVGMAQGQGPDGSDHLSRTVPTPRRSKICRFQEWYFRLHREWGLTPIREIHHGTSPVLLSSLASQETTGAGRVPRWRRGSFHGHWGVYDPVQP